MYRSVVSVAALGASVADDLLRLPLLRGMFCELIGKKFGLIHESSELLLLGLLSVMAALLNVPMPEVLKGPPVDEEIKKALSGRESRYRPIFELLLDYESGTWEQLTHSSRHSGLHENFLSDLYFRSMQWVGEVLENSPVVV